MKSRPRRAKDAAARGRPSLRGGPKSPLVSALVWCHSKGECSCFDILCWKNTHGTGTKAMYLFSLTQMKPAKQGLAARLGTDLFRALGVSGLKARFVGTQKISTLQPFGFFHRNKGKPWQTTMYKLQCSGVYCKDPCGAHFAWLTCGLRTQQTAWEPVEDTESIAARLCLCQHCFVLTQPSTIKGRPELGWCLALRGLIASAVGHKGRGSDGALGGC